MDDRNTAILWVVTAAATAMILTGFLPPFAALLTGALAASILGTPACAEPVARHLLAFSIVGLGCGVDLTAILGTGREGFFATILSLGLTFGCGWALARGLGVRSDLAVLVTVGTAICGGSAIAAIAPLLRARAADVAAAVGVVFSLNAVALLAFPVIGRSCGLDSGAFGLWCALAIHDTSSVVGAASAYDVAALEIATVTKLTRMLWIIPVGAVVVWWRGRSSASEGKASLPTAPWFLVGFLVAAVLSSAVPGASELGDRVAAWAPTGMTLALYWIGLGLTGNSLRRVVGRTFLFGIALWILLAAASLLYVV